VTETGYVPPIPVIRIDPERVRFIIDAYYKHL
jgi:hypothetical protein